MFWDRKLSCSKTKNCSIKIRRNIRKGKIVRIEAKFDKEHFVEVNFSRWNFFRSISPRAEQFSETKIRKKILWKTGKNAGQNRPDFGFAPRKWRNSSKGEIIECTECFLRVGFAKFVKTGCAIFRWYICAVLEKTFVVGTVVVCCVFCCCLCLIKRRIRYIRPLRRKELLLRRTGSLNTHVIMQSLAQSTGGDASSVSPETNQCHLRRKCVDRWSSIRSTWNSLPPRKTSFLAI